MGNWDQGQLSTLAKGQTLSCNGLASGQLYAIFLYNSTQNDQNATVLVNWSLSSPPVQVTVPGTTANAGLATVVLVWGGDTASVAVSITQTSANPQVQCWLGSVSMPINTSGLNNQQLPNNGSSQSFAKYDRYYAVPPSAWQMLTINSASITQFIAVQFQEAFATVYIVNPVADAQASVVGVGSVSTSPATYFKTVLAPSSSPQMIQEPVIGNGRQWVWMNADSAQDSMAATISLQQLSNVLRRDESSHVASNGRRPEASSHRVSV
jgi:hypothetical protein